MIPRIAACDLDRLGRYGIEAGRERQPAIATPSFATAWGCFGNLPIRSDQQALCFGTCRLTISRHQRRSVSTEQSAESWSTPRSHSTHSMAFRRPRTEYPRRTHSPANHLPPLPPAARSAVTHGPNVVRTHRTLSSSCASKSAAAPGLEDRDSLADAVNLRVPIRMPLPIQRLAARLQTVAQPV